MSVVSLDSKSFGPALGRPGILLIEWWAKGCSPCRAFGPVFEEMAERYPDITFARVEVNGQPELVEVMGVQVLPSLMMFRDGFLLLNHVGALPEPMLEDVIRQARALEYRAGRARVRVGLHGA